MAPLSATRRFILLSRPLHRHNIRFSSCKSPELSPSELETLLATPSWSVKSLLTPSSSSESKTEEINPSKLHHLLRLSALPMPSSPDAEAEMLKTLSSQLHFVRSIQEVDTSDVEPLVAIRDETNQAKERGTFTVESLKDEFDREERVGWAKRIHRPRDEEDRRAAREGDKLDLVSLAPRRKGKYVVYDEDKKEMDVP